MNQLTTTIVTPDKSPIRYGLGLQVERYSGSTWIGHDGSWTNLTILMGHYVEKGCSVVVLSNEFMAPVEKISQSASHYKLICLSLGQKHKERYKR